MPVKLSALLAIVTALAGLLATLAQMRQSCPSHLSIVACIGEAVKSFYEPPPAVRQPPPPRQAPGSGPAARIVVLPAQPASTASPQRAPPPPALPPARGSGTSLLEQSDHLVSRPAAPPAAGNGSPAAPQRQLPLASSASAGTVAPSTPGAPAVAGASMIDPAVLPSPSPDDRAIVAAYARGLPLVPATAARRAAVRASLEAWAARALAAATADAPCLRQKGNSAADIARVLLSELETSGNRVVGVAWRQPPQASTMRLGRAVGSRRCGRDDREAEYRVAPEVDAGGALRQVDQAQIVPRAGHRLPTLHEAMSVATIALADGSSSIVSGRTLAGGKPELRLWLDQGGGRLALLTARRPVGAATDQFEVFDYAPARLGDVASIFWIETGF